MIARESTAPQRTWTVGTLIYSRSGIITLFCWLVLGDFAWWMRDRSVGPMAQWYLNDLKVPSFVFGVLTISLPALIQFVVAPIISVRSDRHRGKNGRRIPFLRVATIWATLGMVGLALTPWLVKQLSLWVDARLAAIACFGACWTVFSTAAIASRPLFDALVNDVVPRPLLGRFFGLFRAIGLLDGIVFNYWVFGLVPEHFAMIMLAAGMIYGVAFMWVCAMVKEGEYPPPPPLTTGAGSRRIVDAVRSYCRDCFAHPYYVTVLLLIMAAGVCFIPFSAFSWPYAQHLGVDATTYGRAVALMYFVSLVLAYPLGWMADRFHPLRMGIGALAAFVILAIWASFFVHDKRSFLVAFVLHGVISGCYYTAAASSLQQQLFPATKFAQFASAALVVDGVARIVIAPAVGALIDRTHQGYHYTFVACLGLALIALALALIVHVRFKRHGGPDHYVPPPV